VQWLVERRLGHGASITVVDVEPVQWVELADTPAVQTVEVEIPAEALEGILAPR
jgi:hypothetical protein